MITAEIFQRLELLSKTDRLLPVGGCDDFKAPLLNGLAQQTRRVDPSRSAVDDTVRSR